MIDKTTLGKVAKTSTRLVEVRIAEKQVKHARVGHLVAIDTKKDDGGFLVGLIDRLSSDIEPMGEDEGGMVYETDHDVAYITLVGRVFPPLPEHQPVFKPSFVDSPRIGADCSFVVGRALEELLDLMSLDIPVGRYSQFPEYRAGIDADRFFQRHAAILGSTGSGKSWTVAALLERAATMKSANVVLFDLHGEYHTLPDARHLRIPGPADTGYDNESLLYLPYWLLNIAELHSMFIDSSEFSAHNQITAFNKAVRNAKGESDVQHVALSSPVYFAMGDVLDEIREANEEMIPGAKGGEKQGANYGKFSRLLPRMEAKITDERLAFMMQSADRSMTAIVKQLMDFSSASVRVIDFSQVPPEILPIVVALVARIIYDTNFWTNRDDRHPFAMICDEAHVYLKRGDDKNPVERRAAAMFDRIAKEGRKYGVSLVVVSQRPSDLSTTIVSQCNNLLVMRMSNRDDLSTVAARVPSGLDSILEALPVLDVGECVILGDAVSLPTRIVVDPPATPPASGTVDMWTAWGADTEEPDFGSAITKMQRR